MIFFIYTKNQIGSHCLIDQVLAIRNASEKWTMPIRDWGQALNQFAIEVWKRTGSVLMIF
jgi:transposase-like protein